MTAKNVKTRELSTAVNKPYFMTSLYFDPISVEPNVGVSKDGLLCKMIWKMFKPLKPVIDLGLLLL